MATYTFRFEEVSMNQVWFEADSEEHAHQLLKKCMDDEMNINELPKVEERNRGIDLDFSMSAIDLG